MHTRTRSRHVLAGAVVAALLAGGAARAVAPGPLPPEADRQLARDIFRELVSLRTTHDVGSTAAAQSIARRLRAAGFSDADVTLIAPTDHPASGNVVIRYRGSASGAGNAPRPVLFLGHLDVVEVSRADWHSDPFTLTERDGYFYGRGAGDMKHGVAALVAALIRLRREGYTPSRDLIVALTADEEAGGDANGPAFLLANHRALVDAALAINLDGGGNTLSGDRRLYYGIGTSEKVYATFTLEATGPTGHGSLPNPDNSIYRLARALTRLEALQFPVTLNATTRASLRMLADLEPGPQSDDMRAVAAERSDPAAADRLSRIPRFNAQLRTTCTPTLLAGGEAENILPQHARVTIQCRVMPGVPIASVQQALEGAAADSTLKLTLDAPPVQSPESPPADILATVTALVHAHWPGVAIVPSMGAGYTDARETRSAGIPTFSLNGAWWAGAEDRRAHGNDERIGVQAFDESVEFTWRMLKAFGDRR